MPTIEQLLTATTFIAALGCALVGGVFFAFSTFVIHALRRLPPHEGIAAMQSINLTVINPMFLGLFLGTAGLCVVVVVVTVGPLARSEAGGMPYLLVASARYLIGTIGVTIACNIPLNNRLATLEPTAPDAPHRWTHYISRWTAWNHVRTVAAILAAASFLMVLRLHP